MTVRGEAVAVDHELERWLVDFFERAPVGCHWLDADGTVLGTNEFELDLLGYAHDEYVGHPIAEFHVDPDVADDLCARLVRGETVRGREARLQCRDGSMRHVLIDASVLWRDGRFVHAQCFTRDVTQQHAIMEALERERILTEERARELERRTREVEQARNDALRASHAKSEFLANVSHEIRTPMTAMMGYAKLLSNGGLRRDQRDAYVDTIRRNGEYLLQLVNDVLDSSKIEAGKVVLEHVAFALPDLVREVETLLRERAAGKGVGLEVVVSNDVPTSVRSDPTRLRQILVNLVGNAIKFTEAGGVRLILDTTDAPTPGRRRIRFTVIDTGIGMDPEEQARLFEPFGQADASIGRIFGGTGLGLVISARLASALGGRIDVASERGRGSAFMLTVDVEPAGASEVRRGPRDVDVLARPGARLAGRILLAEDAPDSRRLLSFYLRKAGAYVEIVDNGKTACDRARAADEAGRPFDAIVMDMQMPEMDGYEAATHLRLQGVRTPIIALTAHAAEHAGARCLEAGCTDYMTKPVERDALLERLAWHLDAGRKERRTRATPASGRSAKGGAMTTGEVADAEMMELLASYVQELRVRADSLETRLAERDLPAIGGLAHQLKGSARAYGFPRITDEAAALEASVRAGRCLDEIRTHVETVAALCREARCP